MSVTISAKVAKALRRMVEDTHAGKVPEHAFRVHTRTGVVIVDPKSARGAYKNLKQAYLDHPEVRERVHAMMGYRKILGKEKFDFPRHD